MLWAVFWINPVNIEVQLGLSATTILILIAFMFSIDRLLPKISYLTRIDYFMFFSMLLVFFVFIEAVVTCTLVSQKKIAVAKRIDWYARFIFPLLYIAMTLYFWI